MLKSKITIFFLFFILSRQPLSCLAETCTEAMAYNKMMALGRAEGRLMNSKEPGAMQKGMELTMQSGTITELINQKKYDAACEQFETLAKKSGVDLKKESEGLITYEKLAKDGGKRGGVCSQADAQIKLMGIHKQIQDQVALGDVDQGAFKKFSEDTAQFSDLFFTNPSEMCKKLDELKVKYNAK